MTHIAKSLSRVWKSAQLYIGFHRDQKGNERSEAKVWPPKNGNASIHPDPEEQCRNAGVFETGFHVISMPYPNGNCETESLLMRLAEKHAEVIETKLQPYGS